METTVKRLYEAMFLVDSAAQADWDSTSLAAKNILEKAGAEIVSMKRWDERKLTYEIAGRDRGTYILCYFHADGQKIRQIERDAQLSEKILRVLILAASGRETSGDVAGRPVPDDVSDKKEDIERGITSRGPKKPDEVKANLPSPAEGGDAKAGESQSVTAARTKAVK